MNGHFGVEFAVLLHLYSFASFFGTSAFHFDTEVPFSFLFFDCLLIIPFPDSYVSRLGIHNILAFHFDTETHMYLV